MASTTIGELKIAITFNNKEYDKSLKDAEKSTKSFSEIARDTIIANIANKAFDAVIGAIGNTIGKMKDFASSTVEIGKAFDLSMSNVAAITGSTAEEMSILRDKAKEMGAATKFTATEAADAMSYMGMAGWKTAEIVDGVAGVMNLAAASGADLAEASDIVTDALTAFGQAASESGRLADIMAAASANSNTNVHLLGETFKYVAPVAGSLGYTMEDTAVAIGLMANAGVKGSEAGTALRTLFTNLVKPTKAMSEAMDELGISITDTSGEVKPLSQLTGELREKFAGLTGAEKDAYAATIAGKEGMSGLLAIVNASEADYQKLTEAINGSAGAAAKMAFTMINNLAGAQELVNSKSEALKLTLYEGVEPALTAVTKASGAVLEALMGTQGGFDILKLAGDELLQNFTKMSETLPGVVLQMVSRIPQIIETLGPAIMQAIPIVVDTIMQIIPMITGALLLMLPELVQIGMQIITSIIEGLTAMIPTIVNQVVQIIPQLINGLISQLPILLAACIQLLMALVEAIPTVIDALLTELPNIINTIVTFLIDNLPAILDGAIQMFMALIESLPTIIQALMSALPTVIDAIVKFLIDNLPMILDGAIQMFMALIESLPTIIESLLGALPDVIDAVVEFLTSPGSINMILDAAITVFFALIDSIPTIIDSLISVFPDVIESVVNFLTNPNTISMILEAAIKLFFALVDAVPRILGALLGSFGTLVGNLWNGITSLFGTFASNFGNFIAGIFKGAINGVIGFIEGFVNTPINIINGFIDIINGAFGWIGVNLGKINLVSLPRMATGGIVPGTSYSGDHNMIMANSGEMVITRSQQAALWDMIESGNYGYDNEETGSSSSYDGRKVEIIQNNTIANGFDVEQMNQAMLAAMRGV